MTQTELNKLIICRMMEISGGRNFVAQAEVFAEQTMNHGVPVTREAVAAVLQDIAATFPDVRFEMLGVMAEADWVTVRCHFKGTHLGTGRHPFVHEGLLAGVPPTGNSFCVQHIHMFRLKDGLIVEHWANRDDVGMVRQLGLSFEVAPPIVRRGATDDGLPAAA